MTSRSPSPASKAGFDGKRITADQLSVVRGKFPAPHVAILAITSTPSGVDELEVDSSYLSALLLGDERGRISGELYGFDERLDATPRVTHLGGDGA